MILSDDADSARFGLSGATEVVPADDAPVSVTERKGSFTAFEDIAFVHVRAALVGDDLRAFSVYVLEVVADNDAAAVGHRERARSDSDGFLAVTGLALVIIMGVRAGEHIVLDGMCGDNPLFHPDHQEAAHIAFVDKTASRNLVPGAVNRHPLAVCIEITASGSVDLAVAHAAVAALLGEGDVGHLGVAVELPEGKAFRRQIASGEFYLGRALEDDPAGRLGPEGDGGALLARALKIDDKILVLPVFPKDDISGSGRLESGIQGRRVAYDDFIPGGRRIRDDRPFLAPRPEDEGQKS